MSTKFYLPRILTSNEKSYSELELLDASRFIVVLAEPGGGKTELVHSLADKLGCAVVTANVFGQIGAKIENNSLVIDAFDELAKLDKTGIHKILGNAKKAHPTNVIVSSRSSEWDNAATSSFEDFLGSAPLLVRLREFNEAEQRSIFEHHTPGENFAAFQTEVARFDLGALLPNPQFLKLFADAYVESGRHFANKRSIFEKAVERLTKEANPKVAKGKQTLTSGKIIQFASEVFAKLLLSGAEGIGTSEAIEANANRMYPLLSALFEHENSVETILATRLFKPGDNADQHRPVHKIVSEYCAADYLTKRIADPLDPLTISNCLPIIAPNSTVRDELRGMLGWMASLGNTHIQEATIALDPYAVLANGDPSQLDASSKRQLVRQLKYIADQDPYFRRGDFWRRFSVAGFFTQEVVDEIKPLLTQTSDGHLRDLILELLTGSPAIAHLSEELRQLVLSPTENENTRLLASSVLLDQTGHDHRADLAVLIFEASETSLKVAAKAIEARSPEAFGRSYLAGFFRVCANLYPDHQEQNERTFGSRYFVKRFIGKLDTAATKWLLDELTKDLTCACQKQSYECDCLNGISKIVGLMLDRYFDMASPPHDPKRVWQWVGNLNFHDNRGSDQSKAVRVLQEDDRLRQGIIDHVFRGLTDKDQIFEAKKNFQFVNGFHSDLFLQAQDYKFAVDLAFDTNNTAMWWSFMAHHRKMIDRGPNTLRRHMREQALAKPAFMREWVKSNRAMAQCEREKPLPRFRHSREMKRRRKMKDDNHAANIKYVQENRGLVESGRHWSCLVRFANLVLEHPDKIEREFGDEKLVRNALKNCLDFIDEHVPDLQRLAELKCASQGLCVETILYAACLEILRERGNLEYVDRRLLRALRTNINMGYYAVTEEDRNALKAEVERLIFPDNASAEDFLRKYIEPQLGMQGCVSPEICWLQHEEAFSPFRSKLSIEWLRRSRGLGLGSLDTLFDIAAQFGNHEELKEIIAERCAEFVFFWPAPTGNEDIEQKRKFWFVRAFYFLNNAPRVYWDWLKADKDVVLMFNERSGSMNLSDHSAWPAFTSEKVEAILDAFVDQWPKVDLPNNWGTGSPNEENAYRFLTKVIWSINSNNPDDAIPVLDRLLTDARYANFHTNLKSIRASKVRNKALQDFEPPTPQEIVRRLDHDEVVTVEGLRQLVIDELHNFQKAIDGGEFNSGAVFYDKIPGEDKKSRKNENESTERIAERLNLRLQPQGITITQEHQLKDLKRSDFTAAKMIGGTRRLLVTEVKGQWHDELYTAAAAQLHEHYSIHPDAEQQGVYLVLWFGPDEKVAGLKNTTITCAEELKRSIENKIPTELSAFLDVFVLDVSIDLLHNRLFLCEEVPEGIIL